MATYQLPVFSWIKAKQPLADGDVDAREPQVIKFQSVQFPSSQFSEQSLVTMWNMSGIIHWSLLSCGEWGHWSSSSKQENKHGQCLLLDRVMESLEVSADHHLPTSNQRDHPRHQGGGPSFCRHLAPLISCTIFSLWFILVLKYLVWL